MSDEEKFDAIIIGAGPAGSACAYVLAREGKNVLLIERGDSPGSKNVTGGRLYTYALELVEPGLYKEAALERKVVREQIMMLSDKTGVTIDYYDEKADDDIPQSFTVLRANFDQWFADKAEAQGAMIACGIKVDDLIEKDGKIVGVKAGEDEMYADIVIAADGVNSLMGQKADDDIPQSFTVLRASFDQWFADKAEAQGAMIACGIKVDDLIEKDGKIVGVKAGEDEMYADIVIAADGVNSLMGQKAGLKKEWTGHEVGVGAKEIIELPEKTIQNRFAVGKGEGAARTILGQTGQVQGGGFIYTNKTSISLGVVLSPQALAEQDRSLADIYQDFKMHPAIYPLIEGGTTVEYSGHLVPENGWNSVPKKLYRDGFMMVGDAAGFCINTGTMIRGIDLAIVSGAAAAKAILAAEGSGIGEKYMQNLEEMSLIPTMKLFAGWPQITSIPRMTKEYPDLMNEALEYMFHVDGKVPEKMTKALRSITKKHVGMCQMISDGWRGFRAI